MHLITYNGFVKLLSDPKLTVFLDNLWMGELTTQCDGRISDYSKLQTMATTPVRKLPGQKIEITQILCWNFKPDVSKESYSV